MVLFQILFSHNLITSFEILQIPIRPIVLTLIMQPFVIGLYGYFYDLNMFSPNRP